MAELPLTRQEQRRLVDLLEVRAGLLTTLQRQNFLSDAGLEAFEGRLDFGVDARSFAQRWSGPFRSTGSWRRQAAPPLPRPWKRCASGSRAAPTTLPSWMSCLGAPPRFRCRPARPPHPLTPACASC